MSQVKKFVCGRHIFIKKKNSKTFYHFTSIFVVKKSYGAIYQVLKKPIKNRFIVQFFYTMSALCREIVNCVICLYARGLCKSVGELSKKSLVGHVSYVH